MTSFGAFGEPGRPDDDYAFPDEPSTTVTDPRVAAGIARVLNASRAAGVSRKDLNANIVPAAADALEAAIRRGEDTEQLELWPKLAST